MKWKSIVLGCYKSAPTVTFIILRKLLPFVEIRFFVSDDGVWKNINIKYSYNYLHPSSHQNRNRNEINARNIEFSLGALGEIDLLDLVLHRRRRQQEEQEENTMNRAEEKSVWRMKTKQLKEERWRTSSRHSNGEMSSLLSLGYIDIMYRIRNLSSQGNLGDFSCTNCALCSQWIKKEEKKTNWVDDKGKIKIYEND